MNLETMPAFAAALMSGAIAIAMLARKRRSVASWCFFGGMILLSVESIFNALSQGTAGPISLVRWQTWALLAKCGLPVLWLGFSVTYSRGNYLEFLRRWRLPLVAALLLPFGIAAACHGHVLQPPSHAPFARADWIHSTPAGKAIDVLLLSAFVLILMNLEKTFRAAVGTMRWRIKFLVLGLAVVFGARLYTESETLLYSGHSLALAGIDSASLLIGCILVATAYLRSGFAEIEIYPSHAVMESSITVLLAGGYLFIVGVLAQVVAYLGGTAHFQLQAFFILLGIAALAVLIFSERLRLNLRHFVSRHFQTSQRDIRKIWTLFTQRMASVMDQPALCLTSARLISETFNILSVTVWLLDRRAERLIVGASTAIGEGMPIDPHANLPAPETFLSGLRGHAGPFNLEKSDEAWAAELMRATPSQFREGGNRIGLPLMAGDRPLGIAVLADRVNGARYSVEELDLLKCIGDQIAAALLNLRLSEELAQAREIEAFQTMSAFFVHDLKNGPQAWA